MIDNEDKLLEFINKNLKPKEAEKKQFGEVFTPLNLVNEMLDKLPDHVWTDKNLKWFEPASGMGNFAICVYLRLLKNLKPQFNNENKTKEHILKHMLYMSEINSKNVEVCKNIFGVDYLNIHHGDTLKLDIQKEWGIENFDIIMGNPPYQDPTASGDNKLYLDFTKKSIKLLHKNGLLLFITPRTILEYLLLNGKNRQYIDQFYQLQYISIETSNKYFPNVGSTFVYFILEKIIYTYKTTIDYLFNKEVKSIKIKLYQGFKIPKILTKLDIEILSHITSETDNYILNDFKFNNKTQRIRKQHISKNIVSVEETDKNKIKIIDTINKSYPFPGKYYYYYLKDNDFNQNKLILSKKGYLMPVIDKTKQYTYSDNFKYILGSNLEQIKLLFDSNITKYLLFQYSKNGFDSIEIIKMLKKEELNNIKNENDLYKLYHLTTEHIDHIKMVLKLKK